MEHFKLQRLQLEQSTSSLPHSSTSSSTSHAASRFGFSQMSPSKFWLLASLLLLTVAVSWPTGTSAAPRIARGAHLILPHLKSSTEAAEPATKPTTTLPPPSARPHRRHHKLRRHHQVLREATQRPVLLMSQVKGVKSCPAMEPKAYDTAQLVEALKTAQSQKDTVICLTEDWLEHFFDGTTIAEQAKSFSLFQLNLQHPLQEQVSKVQMTAEGKFEYDEPVGTFDEELPKIIETLLVLDTLVNTTKYDDNHKECTFKYITYAVQNNISKAFGLMQDQQCNAQKEVRYSKTPRLPFFILMETIKVLTILEHTYEQLIIQAQ